MNPINTNSCLAKRRLSCSPFNNKDKKEERDINNTLIELSKQNWAPCKYYYQRSAKGPFQLLSDFNRTDFQQVQQAIQSSIFTINVPELPIDCEQIKTAYQRLEGFAFAVLLRAPKTLWGRQRNLKLLIGLVDHYGKDLGLKHPISSDTCVGKAIAKPLQSLINEVWSKEPYMEFWMNFSPYPPRISMRKLTDHIFDGGTLHSGNFTFSKDDLPAVYEDIVAQKILKNITEPYIAIKYTEASNQFTKALETIQGYKLWFDAEESTPTPSIERRRVFGKPTSHMKTWVSIGLRGKLEGAQKPLNSPIFKPMWKALAISLGVPTKGEAYYHLLYRLFLGLRILKEIIPQVDFLFSAPRQITDQYLIRYLDEYGMKFDNQRLSEKLALREYLSFMTGIDIHTEQVGLKLDVAQLDDVTLLEQRENETERLKEYWATVKRYVTNVEEQLDVIGDNYNLLLAFFREGFENAVCFDAKIRKLEDYLMKPTQQYTDHILMKLSTYAQENNTSTFIEYLFTKYRDARMSPRELKTILEGGQWTYGKSIYHFITLDGRITPASLDAFIQQKIDEEILLQPREGETPWISQADQTPEDLAISARQQGVRDEFRGVNPTDILNTLLKIASLPTNSGDPIILNAGEFKERLEQGVYTKGIPIGEIIEDGRVIDRYIKDAIEDCLLEPTFGVLSAK